MVVVLVESFGVLLAKNISSSIFEGVSAHGRILRHVSLALQVIRTEMETNVSYKFNCLL